MDHRTDRQLEERLHRELSRLPGRKAPPTLIPRVLAAIDAQAKLPWWKRPWPAWPRHWQVLSFPVLISACIGFCLLAVQAGRSDVVQESFRALGAWFAGFAQVWNLAPVLEKALAISLNAIGYHWLLLGASVVFMMYFACVGLGTVWYRLALGSR